MPALGNRRSGSRGHRDVPAGADCRGAAARRGMQLPGKAAPAGPSATAASTGPAKTVVPPDTPAGAQLRWLIAAMAHLPMSDAQVRAHFDAAVLAQASPAKLNQGLQGATDVKLVSVKVGEPSMLVAIVSTGGAVPRARVRLTVDSPGLIGGLLISPAIAGPVPGTWPASMPSSARSRPGPPARRQRQQRLVSAGPQHRPRDRGADGSAFEFYVLARWAMPWPRARSAGTSR